MDIDKWSRLKKMVESSKEKASRAAGAMDQILARLKKEFRCKTIEEAERLLSEKELAQQSLEKRINKDIEKLEKKWGSALEDD